MEITQCPPNLVPEAVRCIGYRGELAEPLVRRLAPSGGVKLIFRFGDPLRSASGTRQAVPVTAAAVVVGIKDGPGTTAHAGVVDSIQVRLTPLGAYRMLGVPMADLSGSAVDLADVLGPAANVLVERLASADDWLSRFRLLGHALGQRVAAGPAPDPAIAWAWRRLSDSSGRLPVQDLAQEIGMSRRHLGRRFTHQVGLSPKRLARVLRFRQAVRLRQATPALPWSHIAAECGYYDHAHLGADFRALSGFAPSETVSHLS